MEKDPKTPPKNILPTPTIPLLPPPEKYPQLPPGTIKTTDPIDWESFGGAIEGTSPTDLGC